MSKYSLHKQLKERNNIADYTYRLDGAHFLTYMGATSDDLSAEEVSALKSTLQSCFEDIQKYLEEQCGFQVNHFVLTLDARGQRTK